MLKANIKSKINEINNEVEPIFEGMIEDGKECDYDALMEDIDDFTSHIINQPVTQTDNEDAIIGDLRFDVHHLDHKMIQSDIDQLKKLIANHKFVSAE